MARDIASVADKDIREDMGGPDDVPPSERPRSEGGPATREPEPPSVAEAAPAPATDAASETPFPVDLLETIAEEVPAAEAPLPSAPPDPNFDPDDGVADPAADEIPHDVPMLDQAGPPLAAEITPDAPPPTARAPDTEDIAEIVATTDVVPTAVDMEPDLARDTRPDEAEPWRAAIAGALTEAPAESPVLPVEPPLDRAAEAMAGDRAPGETTPVPSNVADSSFTAAAADLFRPPEIEEEPHLITLGRRLNPTLSVPRPVAPDITPRADPVVTPEPWWKTAPWRTHLRSAARVAAYVAGGYLLLVLVLVILFRFVNPPGSMLMLTQFLGGTAIDRRWVPLESISRNLVRAVVVSEDGRFCEHSGIDTAAIKEAIERASRGTPRGASTISMQVTKNLFLWNAKSYVRKVIEIPLTLYMELIWPKARILEVYLNIAEWGPGVFGAEAAAQRHFGKSAARLSERESALLAAVLPNPVVRNAGSPGPQTSAKARVVQARVKAYGTVASCVASAAASPPAVQAPVVRPRTTRKAPAKPAVRKKQQAPANDWAPTLNFGSP